MFASQLGGFHHAFLLSCSNQTFGNTPLKPPLYNGDLPIAMFDCHRVSQNPAVT
jgi:hypothetical protein